MMKHIDREDIARYFDKIEVSPKVEEHLSICDDCLNLLSITAKESSLPPSEQLLSKIKSKSQRRFNILPIAAGIAASLLLTIFAIEILKPQAELKNLSNTGAMNPNNGKKEPSPDFLTLLKTYDEFLATLSQNPPMGVNPPLGPVSPKGLSETALLKKIRDAEQHLGFKTFIPKFNHGYSLKDVKQINNKLVLVYIKNPNNLLLAFEEKLSYKDTLPVSSDKNHSVYFVKNNLLVTLTSKSLQNQELIKLSNYF